MLTRRKGRRIEPFLPQDQYRAMALGTRDGVVKQPSQMLGTACDGVRPKNHDVRKFAVLGALDRHGEMTVLLPKANTRTVAHGVPDELGDLHGGEARLPLRSAQTVHAAECLCNRRVSSQRL